MKKLAQVFFHPKWNFSQLISKYIKVNLSLLVIQNYSFDKSYNPGQNVFTVPPSPLQCCLDYIVHLLLPQHVSVQLSYI